VYVCEVQLLKLLFLAVAVFVAFLLVKLGFDRMEARAKRKNDSNKDA
jgi:hypothetical protein